MYPSIDTEIAQAAAAVFDELVQLDRHGFARTAALWSIQQMAALLKSAGGSYEMTAAEGVERFEALATVRQEARSAPWAATK